MASERDLSAASRMRWLCHLGIHKHITYDMTVAMGWGLFGGPLVTYYWRCARCGKEGRT